MIDAPIPVIVIDDTPVKLRGVCEFVGETPRLQLQAGAGSVDTAVALIERFCQERARANPTLAGWMALSDLHLGTDNGVRLGRKLLEIAPGLRVVIYTQDPSWTLATEIFRQEYARVSRGSNKHAKKPPGLHSYALFGNMEPSYLVSELYNFFAIEGAPSDPGRRVLLAHAYEAYT